MGTFVRGFIGLLVVLALLLAGYTWLVLSWSYSTGERAGYVQKLSKKGWLCKTWEGEIALVTMPGTVAEKFQFSVRDDAVASRINDSMGRRVSLDYEEHVGVPTNCFAETRYFVTGVRVIEDPAPLQPPAAVPVNPAPANPAQPPAEPQPAR